MLKEREKSYHEGLYEGDGPLPPVTVAEVHTRILQPCFTTGQDRYSDSKKAFFELIQGEGGWVGKRVLDYACGFGGRAVYYALTGADRVDGFDISETAIRRGCERVERQGLNGKVELRVADASGLDYPDEVFDIVIGDGVLHHVIKYEGVFEELHRVMKPGARAYFREGLADFPLFRLWWAAKGEVPAGDVPIFSRDVRERARMFSEVRIRGDAFLYSAGVVLWRRDPGVGRRLLLRALKSMDQVLLAILPRLRMWGCFSYIVLTK